MGKYNRDILFRYFKDLCQEGASVNITVFYDVLTTNQIENFNLFFQFYGYYDESHSKIRLFKDYLKKILCQFVLCSKIKSNPEISKIIFEYFRYHKTNSKTRELTELNPEIIKIVVKHFRYNEIDSKTRKLIKKL